VYDVVGWRGYAGRPVLKIAQDISDRHWYGEKPRILKTHQVISVDKLIKATGSSHCWN